MGTKFRRCLCQAGVGASWGLMTGRPQCGSTIFRHKSAASIKSLPGAYGRRWFVFAQVPDVRQAIVRVNSKEKPKASAASSRKGTGYITKAGPVASEASVWAFGGPDKSGGAEGARGSTRPLVGFFSKPQKGGRTRASSGEVILRFLLLPKGKSTEG